MVVDTESERVSQMVYEAGELLVKADPGRRGPRGDMSAVLNEIGTSGLRQFGGYVFEEWLNQLQGRRAAWVWREMLDNDPTVGAVMFAIRWLARGVDWRVEQGRDADSAEFVEQCMHDMSHTWPDFVSESLSMLGYGWSYHEEVLKRRRGPQPDPPMRENAGAETQEDTSNPGSSAYTDGRLGWRKLPVRAQETTLRWLFDGYSGLRGMEQIDWHGGNHKIPISKALLFRTQTTRNNPEGRSILRNAFTSYTALKAVKQTEGIGIERDLAGIPVITPPDNVQIFAQGQENLLRKVQAMVTGIRRDEYDGIVLPSAGWKFELVSSGGSRQIDTDKIARRYRADMAASMLADFVLLGQDGVGSYAMVDVKSDLFGIAIDAILDLVCEVMNRFAIPRLLRLNGMDVTDPPEIHHGSAGRIDLEKVGTFLFQLAGAGAPIPWSQSLLEALFKASGLPANFQASSTDLSRVPVQPPTGVQSLPAGPSSALKPAAPATDGKTSPPTQPRRVAKADYSRGAMVDGEQTEHGVSLNVAPLLRERHAVLSAQLEGEVNMALGELGNRAASALERIVGKADGGFLNRLVGRVMRAIDVAGWVEGTLKPLLRNHAGRVMADVVRVLGGQIDGEVHIAESDAQWISSQAGLKLGLADIEPQIRDSILQAVRDGIAHGEHPVRIADRIREMVPKGRFVNAGAKYRSRLIAREETSRAQRAASLAAYQSNPRVTAVRLRDGVYGPPRSDATCIDRDGEVVPIAQAGSVVPNHPLCTLGLEPVVSGMLSLAGDSPALTA